MTRNTGNCIFMEKCYKSLMKKKTVFKCHLADFLNCFIFTNSKLTKVHFPCYTQNGIFLHNATLINILATVLIDYSNLSVETPIP